MVEEEEDMQRLINIVLKRAKQWNTTVDFENYNQVLNCLGFSDRIDMVLANGRLNIGINQRNYQLDGCEEVYPNRSTIMSQSNLFENAKKNKDDQV